jgi:DNA-binding NtrC family response regulator
MSEIESEKSDRIRLLLVDDEHAYVKILAKRLTKRNFDVTATFSGVEGIQAARREDFDVAVLDLKMEDIDGIEVLKVFKKMAPRMEVIMLTGHGSEEAAREGVQFGAFDYLLKPCELEDLIDKINEAARESKSKP